MKVDVDFVISEFRRGEAETDPYDSIDTLVAEVDRLRGWWDYLRRTAEAVADAPEVDLHPETTAFAERYMAARFFETVAEDVLGGESVPEEVPA